MIGLGVVVFVAVFAQGLKTSFIDSFDRVVRADFIVQGSNFLPLPSDTAGKVQGAVGVQTAAGVQAQQAQVGGKTTAIYAVDPAAFQQVWKFDWLKGGSDAALGKLGSDGVLVEEQTASTLGTGVGKTVTLTTVDGKQAKLKVVGVYRDPIMLNGMIMSDAAYQSIFTKPQLFMVFAATGTGGSIPETQASLKAALAAVPTAEVQTAQEYKDGIVKQVNQLLNLLYGLLAMSVIISIFGIVNTLVLAVFERTREIGLTRADRDVAPAGAVHGALRERHHLDHRGDHGDRRRRRVRLGGDDALRRAGDHLLGPRRAARRVPDRRRDRRHHRRHPAGAAGGADRHPGGDPLRVRAGAPA